MGSFRRKGHGFVSPAGRPRMRYRLWHLMVVVAIVALILGGYVSLFPIDTSEFHVEFYIVINGHAFFSTSPVFWLILVLALAVLLGLLAGFIALIVWAARVAWRRAVPHR